MSATVDRPRRVEVSFVVPAHDEERELPATLGAIQRALDALAQEEPRVAELGSEIVVVDNDSGDRTAEVARSAGARVIFEEHRQIARARNRGARAARGRLIIFCDADTHPSPELVLAAYRRLRDPDVVAAGTLVEWDAHGSRAARFGLSMWNAFSRVTGFCAGCFIACDRQAFAESGGFDESVYAGEEIYLRMRFRRRFPGRKFDLLQQHRIVTSSRKTDSVVKLLQFMFIAVVFPPGARWRWMCGYWYGRRGESRDKRQEE